MPRPKAKVSPPKWFDLAKYADAESIDYGDWLLNLTVRAWLARAVNPAGEQMVRERGPVLKRADDRLARGLLHGPIDRSRIPSDVLEALYFGSIKSAIQPMLVQDLYFHEQRLPATVRAFGAKFEPGSTFAADAPPEFAGTLDAAFTPQMLGRFVRINLALPDDVLIADLQAFLSSERRALATIGGTQPYRDAAHLDAKAHALRSLCEIWLLPFLDLDRWQRAEGLKLTFSGVRGLLFADRSRDKELRRRAAMATDQMKLHAWFARLDRSAQAVPRKRKKPG